MSNLTSPSAPGTAETSHSHWSETVSVFPIYLALAKQLGIAIPITQRKLPDTPDAELFSQVQNWLDSLDQRVLVYQLRHLLQMTTMNASESSLQSLIERHLRKPTKSTFDRDKIDFLLVQYFALCAPAKIYHKRIELADVAEVIKPILGEVAPAILVWCEPLEVMIKSLHGFRSLREILKTNFIEQGRKVKEAAGGMFYDPSALLAFIRFNFILRRTFIELMHADLIATRAGIAKLEASDVHVIDCRNTGLSAAEPLTKIKKLADEWKQPFQKEYTERSVNQAFEKLLGLRADVENALEKSAAKISDRLVIESAKGFSLESQKKTANVPTVVSAALGKGSGAEAAQKSEAAQKNQAPEALDFETCMEKIWEQLIATPPLHGRSMTTVKLGETRILLSSWEVAAFVSETGVAAEDLRRAVAARAMVSTATTNAKEKGHTFALDKALAVGRVEASRLQERVDVAKQAKDTEAAVNLGISTKRLLSALDEAEKL
ncbi:MAG TPA: hypothetical protein VK818_20830 [Methylomirabilota bacterium]|jgi:hypothetical protein|nr:hypothetical protein [Methylomirabilota bacterium]